MKNLRKHISESILNEGFDENEARDIVARFMRHFGMSNDYFLLDQPSEADAGDKCYHFTTDWWQGATLDIFVFDDGHYNNQRVALGNDERFVIFKHGRPELEDWDPNKYIVDYGVRIQDWEDIEPKTLSKLF